MPWPHRTLATRFAYWRRELLAFPLATTVLTLAQRFREDRLGLTAGSLTFTTVMALVPFFTVVLAVFTAFPIFGQLEVALQNWLVGSLIPANIADQVLNYLTQFARAARQLGLLGLTLLIVTAFALVLTIDKTLNNIWRVRRPRSLGKRLLIYWAVLTFGPLLFAASLSLTSYALASTRALVDGLPGGVQFLLDALQFVILFSGLSLLYRTVPNAPVRWRHALAGGLFAALAFEGAKNLLVAYLSGIPTYSAIYGAFATVPIMLLWIYVAWVIVLLGAVVAAYLPSLLSGVLRQPSQRGWQFELAIELLQQLERARNSTARGLSLAHLSQMLRVDTQHLEPVLEALMQLDLIALLDESGLSGEPRHVLLADPDDTRIEPMVGRLLIAKNDELARFWSGARLDRLRLRDVL